jgi:hypothetical protein
MLQFQNGGIKDETVVGFKVPPSACEGRETDGEPGSTKPRFAPTFL